VRERQESLYRVQSQKQKDIKNLKQQQLMI